MHKTRFGSAGYPPRAQQNILTGLHPSVRPKFRFIMLQIADYLRSSKLVMCAPPSELWITIKHNPRKAVLAFINDPDGNLLFDIDTYAHNDIRVQSPPFTRTPFPSKPNKRHVARVTAQTSNQQLTYLIDKMIEGMSRFE
jgi:hypothetical protein